MHIFLCELTWLVGKCSTATYILNSMKTCARIFTASLFRTAKKLNILTIYEQWRDNPLSIDSKTEEEIIWSCNGKQWRWNSMYGNHTQQDWYHKHLLDEVIQYGSNY